jgi:hypothetical protein
MDRPPSCAPGSEILEAGKDPIAMITSARSPTVMSLATDVD